MERLARSRLEAPVEFPDVTLRSQTSDTPQGVVISPLLANLFLHYTLDAWMRRQHPVLKICELFALAFTA